MADVIPPAHIEAPREASVNPAAIEKYLRENCFAKELAVSDSTRKVLEEYSKIPPEDVMPHVLRIREKAFAIYPYPCIGMGRFLDLAIGRNALYPEVISRVRDQDQTFLDMGCAFGQDIRRLVADGAPSSRCHGSDLRLDFLELGYELFRDKDTLASQFIAADVFDPASQLKEFDGQFDIINTSSFFHLFNYEQQKAAARRVVQLLRPQKDSLIVGRQMGQKTGGYLERNGIKSQTYRQSAETWKTFWAEIMEETGVQYQVEVEYEHIPDAAREGWSGLMNEETVRMGFSVRRL